MITHVQKVMMFVYRERKGEKEFFVLHRKNGDNVVLTGHVGDTVSNETLESAVQREIKEELGVEALNILPSDYIATVTLEQWDKISTEHAFLVQIPDENVHFLEGDERHDWHSLEELENILTYDTQKGALPKIRGQLHD